MVSTCSLTYVLVICIIFNKGWCAIDLNTTNTHEKIDGFLKFSASLDPFLDESESGSGTGEERQVESRTYHNIDARIVILNNDKKYNAINASLRGLGISDNKGKSKWHKWENLEPENPNKNPTNIQSPKVHHFKSKKLKHKNDIDKEYEQLTGIKEHHKIKEINNFIPSNHYQITELDNETPVVLNTKSVPPAKLKLQSKTKKQEDIGKSKVANSKEGSNNNYTKLEVANISFHKTYTDKDQSKNKSRAEDLSDIIKYKPPGSKIHKRQHKGWNSNKEDSQDKKFQYNNRPSKINAEFYSSSIKSKINDKRPDIDEVTNATKLANNTQNDGKNKTEDNDGKSNDDDNNNSNNTNSDSNDNTNITDTNTNTNTNTSTSTNTNTNTSTSTNNNTNTTNNNVSKDTNKTNASDGKDSRKGNKANTTNDNTNNDAKSTNQSDTKVSSKNEPKKNESSKNKDYKNNTTNKNDSNKTNKKEEKDFKETLIKDDNDNYKNKPSLPKDENNVADKNDTQDESTKQLQSFLRKLRFKNGVSGHVKTGQEFAYISQCGLYTEPQNVSFVQHSWVTKTYSPYFYLYEKPKKYEKCKPSAWMNGTDMRGSVFLSFEVKSLHGSTMENNAKICEKYCCKEPRCAAWVLRLQSDATSNCPANSYCCWLKTDTPKPEQHDDCVSGVVHREHYKHPPTGMRSAVPLGALGTGSFEMRADGTFHEWTIENQSPGGSAKLSKTSLEMMLLGIRIKKGNSNPKSAVVRTHAPHGFESVDGLTYSGAYPVSKLKIDFHKSLKKDVDLNLYAYSTFHPRNPSKSATPAVVFTLDINNPSSEDLDVSFMLNLPFGYNDDTIRRGNNFAEIAYTRLVTAADCQNQCANRSKCMAWTTNGPFSCMLKDGMPVHSYEYGIISGLKGEWIVRDGLLNCKRPGFYPQSGDISLYPVFTGSEESTFTVADDPENIWAVFKKTGSVNNGTSVNTTGLNGAVSISTTVKPKDSKLLTIIFAWHFPNKDIAEERVGNFYNNLFKSSIDVAKHSEDDLNESLDEILKWQATVMGPDDKKDDRPKKKGKKKDKLRSSTSKGTCDSKENDVNVLPTCLQDIMVNTLSTLRTGMWMENGRWRQWEAYDCANMDPVHVDLHRIMPYIMFYPEISKQIMLAWADHQLANGMIQESLSVGCLEETSKEGVAGGRMMADVNVGFITQAFMIYSWTNDTSFFEEIYPFAVRAMWWLINDATKGTGLPFRKPDTYDLFELEKYDHCAYNSILYILALNIMKIMANIKSDVETFTEARNALNRAEKQFDIEMWDERREFFHAWFDDEWGSPPWLMSDILYGQVWAYTLGLGDLIDREKIKKHLKKEGQRNNSPFGLKAISKSDNPAQIEDTSVILGDELNSCKSLENVTKTESVWMSSSTDWSILQLHMGMEPKAAMEQAVKSLDNYRSTLRDQWNFHGLTSSEHYGLDGLPWATSHYTFHLVLWHLPVALSGQQYYAPNGTLLFTPKYDAPYSLPFYIPQCMGNIEASEDKSGHNVEIVYKLRVSSGSCTFWKLAISDEYYGKTPITIEEGETIEWSAPKKSKKDIVKAMLDQLKH